MPTWILRAILATSIASLGMNAVVTYIVVSHTRGAVIPDGPRGGTTPRAAPVTHSAAPVVPFQPNWEFVDRATGKRIGAVVNDDSPRMEQFVRQAGLNPADELALRERWTDRRTREMQLAEQLVKDGAWNHKALHQLQQQFWDSEYRALPPEQAMNLPPEFRPAY